MEKDQHNQFIWDIIDTYFNDNPQSLVRHHIDSFNDFFKQDIYKIFKERNPVLIVSKYDESIGEYRSKCNMYIGGKNGDLIHFAKPVIYDNNAHYMFPNEARLRNMTYSMTIHVDVELEFIDILDKDELPHINVEADPNADPVYRPERRGGFNKAEIVGAGPEISEANATKYGGSDVFAYNDNRDLTEPDAYNAVPWIGGGPKKKNVKQLSPAEAAAVCDEMERSVANRTQTRTAKIENIFFGKFPIMVQSDFCILAGLPREMRFNMGECKNDIGGYFIIDGKEKTVIPQEKFGDNMLRVSKATREEILYSSEIKSVSENTAKPIRTLRVDLVAPGNTYSNMNIVVNIPNVRKPVPLFIVFRALGIITDKDIVETCLLDLQKYESMMDLFIPSVHDAGPIMTQAAALHYIAHLTKTKTTANALFILTDYFLPHIGETNYLEKAYFLGYMVKRLLTAYLGMEPPIDRDSFRYKRVELVGTLMNELFRTFYKQQFKFISVEFEKKLYYNRELYENDLHGLVMTSYKDIFGNRIVEEGFRKAFKGNWPDRIGVVQDLNRLSFNTALSHLRKTNLSVEAGAKLVGPRVLNGSQWGLVDPIDTPDGGNIGLHKQLCIMTYVSRSVSREPMIVWLKTHGEMQSIMANGKSYLSEQTKIIVNGYWAGVTNKPFELVEKFKLFRRNGLIPLFCSICFESRTNTINIFTDGGRLCRPIFYYDKDMSQMSFDAYKKGLSWEQILSGQNARVKKGINSTEFYELPQLYEKIDNGETNPYKLKRFIDKKGIIDYIDPNEEETSFISLKVDNLKDAPKELLELKKYTHCEIHESLIFGMMCNLVIFPHHNPATRNSFSTGQSKQAVSMYHTNFTVRMDKTAVVLNQGQKPLVKSRYYDYICHEENPYGENTIVALMCYTGYNVEDAVLVNEGALQRGLFRTTYYTVYEAHEERETKGGVTLRSKKFINIGTTPMNVRGIKPEHDYSKLDEYGLVKEGTEMNDRTIIIGAAQSALGSADLYDMSKTTKKGQLGIVDKTFITEGEEGTKVAKVRIREERIPAMGDKMASRSGQKGTIGQIIPEQDMPFTKNGLRPDIIVNPHAIPTRMTIGQLVETLVGKTCLAYGYHGDCTAFMSSDKQIGAFGAQLNKCGYHSSGNEVFYNGMTGEQLDAEVYVGPNYYMRLKHMVKDKVNYRARGPRMMLTRQPVGGRANDGGLRIGEMERDVMVAHGATDFLRESMLDRGDHFFMAVCNKTGGIAIYNPDKDLFLSPYADGPLQFTSSLDGKEMHVEQISKFGRSFSVVKVPYVFKLLIQELQTINIKLCIVTEDNINQFDSMNFSHNLTYLTNGQMHKPEDVVKFVDDGVIPKPVKKHREHEEIMKLVPIPQYEEVKPSLSGTAGQEMHIEDIMPTNVINNFNNDNYGYDYYGNGNDYYGTGQQVIFGGDSLKPSRIWRVKDKRGDFATIVTDDFEGGLTDPVNVVHVRDLKPASSLIPVGQIQQPIGQIQQPIQPAPMPAITIVTGDGNKVEAATPVVNTNTNPPITSQPVDPFSMPLIKPKTEETNAATPVTELGFGKGEIVVKKV